MLRRHYILLTCLAVLCCAAPRATTSIAGSQLAAPLASGQIASASPGSEAAGARGKTIDKLDASVCMRRGFGCGSCSAEGTWGALWVEDDCTRHCDQICGVQAANTTNSITLAPLVSGPNLMEMKVTIPTGVLTPTKPAPCKKYNKAEVAASLSIVETSTSFTVMASHDTINCGTFGRAQASTTCNPPLVAHCWCDAAGLWGKATCDCRPPQPSLHPATSSKNCLINPQPHASCPAAGLMDVNEPGCATNCATGTTGLCKDAVCVGNTWTQSVCACVPN